MNLLGPQDPEPVIIQHRDATSPFVASPFVIVCDHAGNRIPAGLAGLGLSDGARARHAAWDIGAAALSRLLGESLGATVIEQVYSRLVIDCNREPGAADSIVGHTDIGAVPGNQTLDAAQREARRQAVFLPYHEAITAALDRHARADRPRPPALVSIHSFTPALRGVSRPWHVGVLHNGAQPLASRLLNLLRENQALVVGDNQPYALSESSDYTLHAHAVRRGLDGVEIEVRQDEIADPAGQRKWAAILGAALRG